jgi:hypothetical protein
MRGPKCWTSYGIAPYAVHRRGAESNQLVVTEDLESWPPLDHDDRPLVLHLPLRLTLLWKRL